MALTAILLMASTVAIFAACAFIADRLARRRVAAAATWPTAAARIVAAELVANPRGGWLVRVSYAYEVAGRTYASDRLRPGGSPYFQRQRKALATIAPYAAGASVIARYDPQHPDRSVLELKTVSVARAFFAVMAGSMAAATLLVLLLLAPGAPR